MIAEKLEHCPNCEAAKNWLYDAQRCMDCGFDALRTQTLPAEQLIFSALEDIRSHLSAALAQTVPSDDQIIIGHVRTASARADGLWKDLKSRNAT